MARLPTWALLLGSLLMAAGPASARKWTNDTGAFSVEAELVDVQDGNVRLKRPDGTTITVAVAKLSQVDRDYLAEQVRPRQPSAAGGMQVERYPNGQVKAEYTTNDQGQKIGPYVEYYESGVVKIKATYRNDLLNGSFSSYRPDKKLALRSTYRDGKLHGDYVEYGESGKIVRKAEYVDGQLHGPDRRMDGSKLLSEVLWERGEQVVEGTTPTRIKRGLEAIGRATVNGPGTDLMKDSLRRLMCYRFLCGVPYEGMELNQQMNLEAECAAKVCEGLGHLTHNPESNPGLPEEVFELGKKGAARSNLHSGGNLLRAIDGWMDDSDQSNIDRIGHRRWFLNPPMQIIGLGDSGKYAAAWVFDKSRPVKDWLAVAYPPRGYIPTEYFGPRYAWSISFNQRHWVVPQTADALRISIYPVETDPAKELAAEAPEPLKLDYVTVAKSGFGAGPCLIFRPEKLEVKPGRRYRVAIEGITTRRGQPATISYLVEFM